MIWHVLHLLEVFAVPLLGLCMAKPVPHWQAHKPVVNSHVDIQWLQTQIWLLVAGDVSRSLTFVAARGCTGITSRYFDCA